jgi:hypothetical protein
MTQPGFRYAGLTYSTATCRIDLDGSDGNGTSHRVGLCQTIGIDVASASPAGSVSNTAAMTFGPFSSSNAIQGMIVTDTFSIYGGNILWFGTLLTARTVLPGDTLVVAAGQLLVTIA